MNQEIPFLEKIADEILNIEESSILHTVVVLPNNRSVVFLKNHLANKLEHDLWLPDMMTIDEMMVQFSGLNLLDPLSVHLHLFEVHQQIEKENARSLDDFLGWAPLMLNDFSELDFYMADVPSLFRELSQAKAMEKWNLDGKPLTTLQKQYLDFFHALLDYYQLLQKRLLQANSAYKGMAYRRAAEKAISGRLSFDWKRFLFVGFNALTTAEKTVVQWLKQQFTVDYFVDADHYYLDAGKGESLEAGRFLREALKVFKIDSVSWVGNGLLEGEKEIEVIETGKNIGQVKYAARQLRQWFENPQMESVKTAVVLMDENLLVPLLSEVPVQRLDGTVRAIHYNVSMGYPLSASPFVDYIRQWLKILIVKSEDTEKRLWVPGLIQLMSNPLMGFLLATDVNEVVSEIKKQNLFFQEVDPWLSPDSNPVLSGFLKQNFVGVDSPAHFLKALNNTLVTLSENPAMTEPQYVLLRNQLLRLIKVVKVLNVMLAGYIESTTFHSLQTLFDRLISQEEISLKGEPLSGVQVMGLLETRNLDFENLIILGANEGLLPKTGFQDSFVPFDLRRAYQLPLPNAKTSIVAYHFFRLLQRAKNIVLIYNSEAESLGGGQASRFILQLEHVLQKSNPHLHLKKKVLQIPIQPINVNAGSIVIAKDEKICRKLDQLAVRGISPSAFTTFVRCPLRFYFTYLLRPKIPENLETSIESNTFGSVIHASLEKLYNDFVGKEISPENLQKNLNRIDAVLMESFTKIYGNHPLSYGKNLLIVEVAKTYIQRFVKNDIIQQKKQPFFLVALEQKLEAPFALKDKSIKIKGFIDRVDRQMNTQGLRIVDYKTGKVTENELKIKDWDDLVNDSKYEKALQVLIYQWLYRKNYPDEENVSAGLISLRSAQNHFMPVRHDDLASVERGEGRLEKVLSGLLNQIFDPQQDFEQTSDSDQCTYCDFKQICMR